MKLKKVKLKCEIEIPFWSYDSKKKNLRAESYIKRWITETLKERSFIPLYVEKDDGGSYIEDCSKQIKVRVTKRK